MITDISIKEVNKYEEEVLRRAREWYSKYGLGEVGVAELWEAVGQMCEHENLVKYQEEKKK